MPNNTKNRTNRSEETRSRIVQAAVQMFADHGFDGASTRQIARLADANQGLVTYYFSSKENLWKEAVQSIFRDMQAEFIPRVLEYQQQGLDARTLIRNAVHDFVRYAAHHPEQMRLMMQEGRTDSERMAWVVDEFVKPAYQFCCAAVEVGQAEGILPPGSPVHFFYIFVGSTSLIFASSHECRHLTGMDPTDEAFIEAHAETLSALILRG